MNNTTTQKRKVGRPRKEETAITTKRDFESEILGVKKLIEELRTQHHELSTSFTSRVEKIKDKMYNDYMERRKIYEEEVQRLTKKIVKQETRKFVEGQIITKRHWNGDKIYILVNKIFESKSNWYYKDCSGFSYNTIGVSGVGTKSNNLWLHDDNKEVVKEIEIVCDTKNFVLLCERYGIRKPKLSKLNLDIIYEGIFRKTLNGEFNYSNLHKLGIITK